MTQQPGDLATMSAIGPPLRWVHLQRWFRLLVAGSLLWGFSVLAFALTHDRTVVPTVVVLGAFVVPVAWLVRISERDRPADVTAQLLVVAFVGGGTLGFLSSALLETPFASFPPALFRVGVGLVEEAAKLLTLVGISRRLGAKSPAVGFVLGAAVGFGFEALEDAGYALTTLYEGHNWSAMVTTELTRAVTTPITHGLWTAILGAVLFHQSRDGRFRLTVPLAGAFAAIAGLHALWDLTPSIGMSLNSHLLGRNSSPALLPQSLPGHATSTIHLLNQVFFDIGQALLGIIGLVAAHRIRHRYRIDRSSARSVKQQRNLASSSDKDLTLNDAQTSLPQDGVALSRILS
jgi:RsiW-degrading membrane proteinase PrsW (M82 family)